MSFILTKILTGLQLSNCEENLSEDLTDEGSSQASVCVSSWLEKNMEDSPLRNKGALKESAKKELQESFRSLAGSDSSNFEVERKFSHLIQLKQMDLKGMRSRLNSEGNLGDFNSRGVLKQPVLTPTTSEQRLVKEEPKSLKKDISRLLKEVTKRRKDTCIDSVAGLNHDLKAIKNTEIDMNRRTMNLIIPKFKLEGESLVTVNDVEPG